MTIEELQSLRDDAVRGAGVVREQFGDRSVEYAKASDLVIFYDREIARASRGASGGSMCNLGQYNGYRGSRFENNG